MDTTLTLGNGDALDAVDAALVLQVRPHAVGGLDGAASLDGQAHVLVPTQVGIGGVEDLHGPSLTLGVAGVHAGQVGGEQRRLLTAFTGLDLDDDVAGVVRIAWDEDFAQTVGGRCLDPGELRQFGCEVGVVGS